MIGLLQRVVCARVEVDDEIVGAIDGELVVLVGVERGDTEREAARLVERLLGYRVFGDQEGRMNVSLTGTGGGLLLVPQFTLPADTRKGTRPSFTPAAAPAEGERQFDHLVGVAREMHSGQLATGRFGAHMHVHLVNDGPVTFWLQVTPPG